MGDHATQDRAAKPKVQRRVRLYHVWHRYWRLRHGRLSPGHAPKGEPGGRWGWHWWKPGDRCHWRGVRLVCCTDHYAGDSAEHPWDPGWGWSEAMAAQLWRPMALRDRILLRIVARGVRGADIEQAIRNDVDAVEAATRS
jgi:hypothetical protein